MTINPYDISALQALRRHLPEAAAALRLDLAEHLQTWTHALDVKVLPKLQPDFPLVVAICGGGSAGKSTLFNSLIGSRISPTGGRAGLNRRVLAAVHERHAKNVALFDALAHSFGGPLRPMDNERQLTTPGDPVFCVQPHLPERVVLLDTPDIDTGARGAYANRESARRSLESADVFIYIFTNATYNNRENTDFIANLLTGIGTRPCYLVYRVYPSFSDAEVREHAGTVAANIYGRDAQSHLLGIFRADDDNRVAAGEQPMQLRAVSTGSKTIDRPGQQSDLKSALAELDAIQVRQTLLDSMMSATVRQARGMGREIEAAARQLRSYDDALTHVLELCVQRALSHFPTDQVMRRFADIWLTSDPTHIKVMRRTGKVVEWPLKMVLSALRARSTSRSDHAPQNETDPAGQLELDLLKAANTLHQATVADRIDTDHGPVDAPPAVQAAQQQIRRKDWTRTLALLRDQKQQILSWSHGLEADLKTLADDLRQRMGVFDQIRQTFSALLNVIPATAAITYILHTGDPAGAVGIKVKLTGLLGLHDLYALIAIPATAGLKKADQRQLEQMLAPVAQTWLAHKLTTVKALFESHITADVLYTGQAAEAEAERLLGEIKSALAMLDHLA